MYCYFNLTKPTEYRYILITNDMYLFKINPIKLLILSGLIFQLLACDVSKDTTKEMSILLNEIRLRDNRPEHPFVQVGNIAFIDSLLKLNLPKGQFAEIYFRKAIALLAQGEELEAIKHFEKLNPCYLIHIQKIRSSS